MEKNAGVMDLLRRAKDVPKIVPQSFGREILGNARSMAAKAIPALGLASAAYAVPYAITSAKEKAERNADKADFEESYQRMFDKLPQLQEVVERDGDDKAIRENFEILANMSPDVAKTPAMAAAFVHSALTRGPELFTTSTVKDMVGIQDAVNRSKAMRQRPMNERSGGPFILSTALSNAGKLMQ